VVAKGIRIENNVYVLKEEKEESYLSKYDENWLWNRRLGHLNFDHLVKIRNSGVVKVLPKISKPYDFVCKPCQIGKLTQTHFKDKNFASQRNRFSYYIWTYVDHQERKEEENKIMSC
jgi:hypothetical protein